MKSLRFLLSVLTVFLLGAGYVASQVFYFSPSESSPSRAAEWAKLIDTPPVVGLSLLILLAALILALVKNKGEVA